MKLIGFNAGNVTRSLLEILQEHKIGSYRLLTDFRNGHSILESNNNRIYVIFKKEPFYTFNRQFKQFIADNPQLDGLGESINIEVLERCKTFRCEDIVIIHPNEIYVVPPNLISKFCMKYGLVRGQNKLNSYFKQDGFKTKENISEVTFSFPQKIMQTFSERYRGLAN